MLRSYVSTFLASRLLSDVEVLQDPAAHDGQAAVLFADIAGFTPLAERLAAQPNGAEELSRQLNDCFGTLTALVAAYGGEVITFAGDALIAAWDAGAGPRCDGLHFATTWAARCAQAMQRVPLHTGAGASTLLLRIGIGAGPVTALRVGGVGGQWQLLLHGPALAQVGPAAHRAPIGEVVLSAAARQAAGSSGAGELLGDGQLRLTAVAPATGPPPHANTAAVSLEHLRACIPDPVQMHVEGGQDEWLAELRQITTVFIGLTDEPHTWSHPLRILQPLVAEVQSVLLRSEGTLQRVLVDDKGVVLVAAFGPPPQGHQDDPIRAVRTAMDVHAACSHRATRLSIGVTTGRAFCGPVGSDRHREYMLLGDVVNLAARLMQASSGAVLCDGRTAERATGRTPLHRLADLTVKGKSAPVPVYRPGAVAGPASNGPPAGVALVGRASELARLELHLERLRQGIGGCIEVVGEPGIGKSRIIAEFVRRAAARDVRAFVAAGDAIDMGTPYHAWRPVFAELFGLTGLSDTERRHALSLRLEQLPRLADRAPLLDRVLPVELPDTRTTRQMTGQARADSTVDVLVDVLLHGIDRDSAPRPMLLVLDDAHWFDSASWAVAQRAAAAQAAVLLISARRPDGDSSRSDPRPGQQVERIVLQPLAPDDAAEVLAGLLPAGTPVEVQQRLQDRAQGVPFFLEELAHGVADSSHVHPSTSPARPTTSRSGREVSVPYGVSGVVGERLDRLSPSLQLTLKSASVIGRRFAEPTLRAIHPMRVAPDVLRGALAELQQQAFIVQDDIGGEPAFRFRHALTQEVSYDRILDSQRRPLHRAVARWFEQEQPADAAAAYGLLAYHWRRGGDADRAIGYLERAGEHWLFEGACGEAVDALDGALRLADETTASIPPQRRARWHRQLADAYMGLGLLPSSRAHAGQALELLGRRTPSAGPRAVGQLVGQVAEQGLHRLRRPRTGAASGPSLIEAARANERLAVVEYYSNAKIASLTCALRVVNLAERAPASAELARGYAAVGLGAGMVGLHPLARRYVRTARGVARRVDDLPALAFVLLTAGAYETSLGHWQGARAALDEGLEISERLGDRRRWGELAALRAQLLHHQGDFRQLAAWIPRMQAVAEQAADRQHTAHVLVAEICLLLPRAQAERAADQALQVLDLLAGAGAAADEILAWGLSSKAELQCGRPAQARTAAARTMTLISRSPPVALHALEGYSGTAETLLALDEADDRGLTRPTRQAVNAVHRFARSFPVAQPRALLLRARADFVNQRPDAGLRRLRLCRQAAVRLSMPYEQALAIQEIGRQLPLRSPSRNQHLDQALRMFRTLGATHDIRRTEGLLLSQ